MWPLELGVVAFAAGVDGWLAGGMEGAGGFGALVVPPGATVNSESVQFPAGAGAASRIFRVPTDALTGLGELRSTPRSPNSV